ncbi:YdeI/OmpD-associated family protein [Hephaestia sp. GCM10023244]|uniref:YdeI/OmpD-associated family protein n=1 Tax=unclassified Hephaestia TaxID=2631281 RepID=UPI0020773561|nr:YdeI/OmpD-associated family protein [Hephaestia sp. MAHUQ-44]
MTDPSRTFSVTLTDEGAIVVPFDPRTVFGKARAPVIVTLNGHRYRSTIAIMSGVTFVPLRRSHRAAAGVAQGDTITVTLTLDTAPRTVTPPADLAVAIHAAGLDAAWARLSYTSQREAAEAVEGAKKSETRERRIVATIEKLRG